ncbi:MAG: histidinol-phosphatase [Candidatus Altiarchaeales archaeon HGW-Altiarchaeales-2]|nr:MAG: histidinol-phosphatase [Candidatus Altiarchaeales archaeon HGW-Altiarchaeales-2]
MMRFDFHIHSKYSYDSISKISDIIKRARIKGFNGIAITDHETIKGAKIAEKYSNDEFIAIVGCEINTEIGDIIGLFLNEEIKSRKSMDVIDEIKGQGGIVVLPHPFRGHKWNLISDDILENIGIIEGFNSRSGKEENLKSRKLANEMKLPMIAGSDAHLIQEIGNALTIFYDVELNDDNIQKVITNNKISRELNGVETSIYQKMISSYIGAINKRGVYGLFERSISLPYKGIKRIIRDYKK